MMPLLEGCPVRTIGTNGVAGLDSTQLADLPAVGELGRDVAVGFDPYAVLGVSRDATGDQIAQARRRLSRQYHPDVNGAPDSAARFDEVQRAFTLLSDPAARAEFDRAGGRPGAPRPPGAAPGAAPGIVVQPASVDFGRLGLGRPVADATVTVTWTGVRPQRITSDQGGEWWTTVGTAVSSSSSVALFHLRARVPAGIPEGRRQARFTATLDGDAVAVDLTAEFMSEVPPILRDTDAVRNMTRPLRASWVILVAFVVLIIVAEVLNAVIH